MDPSTAGSGLLNYGTLGIFAFLMVGSIGFLVKTIFNLYERTLTAARADTKETADALKAAADATAEMKGSLDLVARAQNDSNAYRLEVSTALKGLQEAVNNAVEAGKRDREDIRRLLIERTGGKP